jgi:hypothetical protein
VVGFSSYQTAYCRATPVCQLSPQRFGFVRSPLCVVDGAKNVKKNVQVRSSFSESSLIVQKGCELVLLRSHTTAKTQFCHARRYGVSVRGEEGVSRGTGALGHTLASTLSPRIRSLAHTRIMFLLKAHSQEKKLHWFLRQTRSPCARPPGAPSFPT